MREFCAKYFSCQAIQERIQSLVGKKNGENDVDNELASTETKSETQPSTIAKIKQRFFDLSHVFHFLCKSILVSKT